MVEAPPRTSAAIVLASSDVLPSMAVWTLAPLADDPVDGRVHDRGEPKFSVSTAAPTWVVVVFPLVVS